VADNTSLNPTVGGDAIRDIDRSLNVVTGTAKTQVMQLDMGGETQESLVTVSNPLPTLDINSGTQQDVLMQVLIELRVHSLLLQAGLNLKDDLDQLRQDVYTALSNGTDFADTSN
jgi:hypothetical protein